MYDSNLIRFLIIVQVLPLLFLWGVIFRRKLYSRVPWFTIYLSECLVSVVLSFWAYQSGYRWAYFIGVWIDTGIAALLGFMATLDIIRNLFESYRSIRRALVTIFIISSFVLVVAAVVVSPYAASFPAPTVRFFLEVDRSVRLIQLGLIMTLFGLSSYFGLNWKTYQIGIPLGFGFEAAGKLALIAFALKSDHSTDLLISAADGVLTMSTLLVWCVYFVLRDPAPVWRLRPEVSQDLDRWNNALAEYMAQSPSSVGPRG